MKETYEGWIKDLDKQQELSLGSTRAKLGASGIAKGSDAWKLAMDAVRSDYQKNLDEIYGSQTYKMVQDYIVGRKGVAATLGLTFDPETLETTGAIKKAL
ncbi:unnamed protein product, partial [marine sediment metagenome]